MLLRERLTPDSGDLQDVCRTTTYNMFCYTTRCTIGSTISSTTL